MHERPVRLIHVRLTAPREGEGDRTWQRDEYEIDPRSGAHAPVPAEPGSKVRAAVLLEVDGKPVLLTPPSTPAAIGPIDADRLPTAMALAAAAERAIRREGDRLQRCERFVVLADLLASAESPSDVFDALVEYLPRIVDAWQALVFHGIQRNGSGVALGGVGVVGLETVEIAGQGLPDFVFPAVALLDREALPGFEDPLAQLGQALFERTPATRLACAGIGPEALAVVIERRSGRDFSPQDWDMLRVASRQAAAALDRLG